MAHSHNDHATKAAILPPDPAKIRKIWLTAGYLAIFTSIEFVLAFTMDKGVPLTSLFVILTFIKTYYIVGEFMHLKYETNILIKTIIIPTAFIVWLIVALLYEGNAVLEMREWVQTWF